MKMSEVLWVFQHDTAKLVFAGAAGGLVRWLTLRENWKEGLAAIFVGALCAIYLGPLIEPLLKPVIGAISPDNDAVGFSSFVVGLGGISLSGFLIDLIRHRAKPKKESEDA